MSVEWDWLVWMFTRWWSWVAGVFVWFLYWWLFRQRCYRLVGGRLFVRHGRLGRWIDVVGHMEDSHGEVLK